MRAAGTPLTDRPAWKALRAHHREVRELHLRRLFAQDPGRAERMTAEAAGLFLDHSKNRITDETLALLLGLARECGLREKIDAMFRGEKINVTENRPVLHVALRAPRDATIEVDGENVVPRVHAVLDRMDDFARRLRRASRPALGLPRRRLPARAGQGRRAVAPPHQPHSRLRRVREGRDRPGDRLARSRSSPDRLPGAQLRALAGRFESAIRTRTQVSIFEVVDEPRAGTLRIRAAFTERGRVWTKLDLARAHGAIADTTGNLGADTLAFLHGALELKIVDAVTGKGLAAAIDDRLVAAPGEQAGDHCPATPSRGATSRRSSTLARAGSLLGSPHSTSSAAPKPHSFPTTVSEETVRARLGSGSGPDRP